MFEEFAIGKRFVEWETNGVFIEIEYNNDYWTLILGTPNISAAMMQELKNGDLQLCFTDIEDVLFIIFRIGDIRWYDEAYEPREYKTRLDFFSVDEGDKGATLLFAIADSAIGELKAVRTFDLGRNFTNRFHQVCRAKYYRPFNEGKYG